MSENRDNSMQAYGFIHCHSEHSLLDSPLKISSLVKKASEMGARAVTLTDHGTCTGLMEFMRECGRYGIKGIPGLEAYVKDDYSPHCHLILLAKNYKGYQEISRAFSEAGKNTVSIARIRVPVMDKEILEKYFGNGNVIATSACINGPLGSILLHDRETERKISRLENTLAGLNDPDDPEFLGLVKEKNDADRQYRQLSDRKKSLAKTAGRRFLKKEKGVISMEQNATTREDHEACRAARTALEREKEETAAAAAETARCVKEMKRLDEKRSALAPRISELSKTHNRYRKTSALIRELKKKILGHDRAYSLAGREAEWYKSVFGDDFYIELQYHGLEEEAYVMPVLAGLARKLDIPVVAANDVHILDRQQAEARAVMQSLRFESWQEPDDSGKELYLKTDRELETALGKILDMETVRSAMDGIRTVCDSCHVVFPEKSHYPVYRDDTGKPADNAAALLREKTYEGIPWRYPDNSFTAYEKLENELDTITELGYADYFLIVQDFVNYAKEYSRKQDSDHIGCGVGPGRGSAVGSLVSYLLGITSVDPLEYGLIFERFLNRDRVTMPDIDMDYSEEVREATFRYVREKYGGENVASIRTCVKQGARASVRNCARTREYELYPVPKGASGKEKEEIKNKRRQIQALGDRICREIPKKPGASLSGFCYHDPGEDAAVILRRARMVENTVTALSVHAAGIIVGDGTPVRDIAPLMNNGKDIWPVQYDKEEVEELGLLKMDFLELKNLDVITECIRRVYRMTGTRIDPDRLPPEPEVFREIFAKGHTRSVFQFESAGMRKMLQDFRPGNIEDIILLVAAYRPGPMDFIPEIIQVKNGRKPPQYSIPELREILRPTYGCPIYQEQLMQIFHVCAGFSLGEADIIRRLMSKKKESEFLKYRPKFIRGLMGHGAPEEEAEGLWDSLADFSKYAFNKSHAAAYAMISYQTAYLKYHYPEIYMCSVLNHASVEKIPSLIYECRAMGIRILHPDINMSMKTFEPRDGAIVYGLGAVKGVKGCADGIIAERKENGYFRSPADFLIRCLGKYRKNELENLVYAGAFDSLTDGSRLALAGSIPGYMKTLKHLKDADKMKDPVKKKETAEKYELILRAMPLPAEPQDYSLVKPAREHDLLGAYISAHPLDSYRDMYLDRNIRELADMEQGTAWYAGVISGMRVTGRKSDGKKMCFFTLEDKSGTADMVCFTREYARYGSLLEDGRVVRVSARCTLDKDDPENETWQSVVREVVPCYPSLNPYLVSYPSHKEFLASDADRLKEFQDDSGHPVILHEQSTGRVSRAPLRVSRDILRDPPGGFTVIPLEYNDYFQKRMSGKQA